MSHASRSNRELRRDQGALPEVSCPAFGALRFRARQRIRPNQSDRDFLVEFEPLTAEAYAAAFFEFNEALELLSGRSVDLVVPSAIRNPYFRQRVEQKKALLNAA